MSADRDGGGHLDTTDGGSRLRVPQFSSYRPAAAASSSASSSRQGHSKRPREKETSHRSHHTCSWSSEKHHRSPRRRSHSPDASSSRHRTRSDHKSSSRRSLKDAAGASGTHDARQGLSTFDRDLFFTDTRGDPDALIYGQDRAKVPKFHRPSQAYVGQAGQSRQPASERTESHKGINDARGAASDIITLPDEIALDDDAIDDPFDPTRPYVKREPRFEQVGGGAICQASNLDLLNRSRPKDRPTGLQGLPVELLHMILVLSHSSELALTCQYMRYACQQASITDKVDFIMQRWLQHYLGYLTKHRCRSKRKSCKRQLAALAHTRDLWWQDFSNVLSATECDNDMVLREGMDVISFASEFGICTAAILDRLVENTAASSLPRVFIGRSLDGQPVRLPKRLFRHIEHFEYAQVVNQRHSDAIQQDNSGQAPPKKRRRRRNGHGHVGEEKSSIDVGFPAWLAQLLLSLAPPSSAAFDDITEDSVKAKVGPVPNHQEMQILFIMLHHYGADASSHSGYPLAMAVHRRSYSLVHLLLLFGANPGCKDGLAVQIAIRNGFLDIVRLLVTGPCLDADLSTVVPIRMANLAGSTTTHPRLGAPSFELNPSHLRLAIQSRQWEVVDYIWHEKQVSPDIACLRLIEKLKT